MLLTIVSFILVMGVIVFVHEFGHLIAAKRNKIVVEEFGFGFPPRLIKLFERGGTVYSINAIPFGGFARMRGEDDPSAPGSFAAASRRARLVTLIAGPAMNFLLAAILLAVYSMMLGMPDTSLPGVLVKATAPNSPAALAGLQIDDRIVAANGQEISSLEDLQKLTASNVGKSVVYTVFRGDSQEPSEVVMTPRANPPANEGALGIQIGVATRPTRVWEAAWTGVQGVGRIIYLTFAIPANLLREGRPIGDAGFMGPVGIAATTGEVVRSAVQVSSLAPVIWFTALLSAALGITNLLPIPALDGGRILFIIVETIRRRRLEPSQEGMVHLIGFGLLLLLVGLLTVREVGALLNGTFPTVGVP
jgi:regulator of sigma E protease